MDEKSLKPDLSGTNAVNNINKHENLLDVLIEFEATLDNFHLYAFEGWEDGIVVAGPEIERYWVTVTLKFEYEDMPNPEGGLRLTKHGAKVYFEKSKEEVTVKPENAGDYEEERHKKEKTEYNDIWLVHIKLPRHFIDDKDSSALYINDDEDEYIDTESAQEAEDEGLEDSAVVSDEEGEDDLDNF